MSATKRRNLKKKIIGCLCLAAIAASMTAAPVVPVVSDVSVISASAQAAATVNVDLRRITSYISNPPAGVTVTQEHGYYKIELQDGYNYKFSGTNSADVQIYVPSDVTANIEFDDATIINYDGSYAFTGSKNNGYYANLFYYNEDKKDLEFMDYSKISDGKANLVFTHASDWAIVIDKEVLGKAEDASAGTSIVTETDMIGTVGRRGIAGTVMSLTAVLAAGTAIVFKRKARK